MLLPGIEYVFNAQKISTPYLFVEPLRVAQTLELAIVLLDDFDLLIIEAFREFNDVFAPTNGQIKKKFTDLIAAWNVLLDSLEVLDAQLVVENLHERNPDLWIRQFNS